MAYSKPESAEHQNTADELPIRTAEIRAMIRSWDGIETPRKDEIIAGFISLIEEEGIPLEEIEACVDSWDSPGERPSPQPPK